MSVTALTSHLERSALNVDLSLNASDISVTSDTSQLGIVPYPDSAPYSVHIPALTSSSKHAEIASKNV